MEARARHRPGRIPREQDNAMTQFDCLVEVARKLKEARAIGEGCSDRALLYFIDMTIVHVCDALGARDALAARPDSKSGPEAQLSVLQVAH